MGSDTFRDCTNLISVRLGEIVPTVVSDIYRGTPAIMKTYAPASSAAWIAVGSLWPVGLYERGVVLDSL
jgi:hypothetical protein